jgi:hypothetical protein
MKLQSIRIKANDFPEDQREFADALGGTLNPFIDKLIIGFNKNFTVDDNLPFEFKTLDTKVDANGIPQINGAISTNLKNLKGYVCINVINLDGTALYPTATPFLSIEVNINIINIRHIAGLPANTNYRLTLLAIS